MHGKVKQIIITYKLSDSYIFLQLKSNLFSFLRNDI